MNLNPSYFARVDDFDLDRIAARSPFRGIEKNLNCADFTGQSESSSTTNNRNDQVTVQAGENSATNTVGAGGNFTGAGGVTASNSTVTVNNLDAQVANNAIAAQNYTAKEAIDANAVVTNNAIAANTAGVLGAFGFGREIVGKALDFAAGNTASNTAVVGDAFNYAALSQQISSNQNSELQHTIGYISDTLAQLTANSTYQTPAAQAEILHGTSPTNGGAATTPTDWTTIAIIAGVGIAALAFLKD